MKNLLARLEAMGIDTGTAYIVGGAFVVIILIALLSSFCSGN